MKTITDTAYNNLTMRQRLRAAVAAFGRDDMEEVNRLAETSQEGEYTIDKLNARLSDFFTISMTINLDLMNCLAKWLLAQTLDNTDFASDRTFEVVDQVIRQSLTECASIIEARNTWLDTLGVSFEDFDRFNSPASPMLVALTKRSEGKQDPCITATYLEQIQNYFKGRYPS
ncbi:MAG: hypothetical protein H7A51_15080 [Akkermansiaceae bacterium]|nr:hypothetical protein [Akkermansiaceae bacterium]